MGLGDVGGDRPELEGCSDLTVPMLELTRELPNFLESQWDGDFDRLTEFVTSQGRLPAAKKNHGRGRPMTEYQLTQWMAREAGQMPQ